MVEHISDKQNAPMQIIVRCSLLILLSALVFGCAKQKTTDPTVVRVTVVASPDVNPDVNGRASPVVVRAYELKSGGQFSSASFIELYEKDKEVLSSDCQNREVLQLMPNGSLSFDREIKNDTSHIAFFAVYRDWQHARWSTLTEIPLNKTSKLLVRLYRLAVTAERIDVSRPKR